MAFDRYTGNFSTAIQLSVITYHFLVFRYQFLVFSWETSKMLELCQGIIFDCLECVLIPDS